MAVATVSYTTVSLMLTTLPQLGSITTLTSGQLYTYAGQAESYINGKIVRKYSLPFTSIPTQLETAATYYAVYLAARRQFTQERINASQWVEGFKTDANMLIDGIMEGGILLTDSAGNVFAGRTDIAEVFSTTMKYKPTFHEGPWTLQVQDAQEIQDELEARDIGPTVADRVL